MFKTRLAWPAILMAVLGSGGAQIQTPVPAGGSPRIAEVDLTGGAWTDWKSIKDDWMKNHYGACLEKFKLKMSCAQCANIHVDAELRIDAQGRLESHKILKSNICSESISPDLEKAFLDYFRELRFPISLRSLILEARLGTGLKC
jgi:hypothetical protein